MMSPLRRSFMIVVAVLYLFPGVFARCQAYTSIVVFGDSLSDTGNDAVLSKAKYTVNGQLPGPATGYTDGRFTDGTDTSPAAHNYNGVWIEQLAAMFAAKPGIKNSLAAGGGNNYAYGFATTSAGTSVFTYPPPNTALSFTINNIQQQVSDYLATNPTITSKTLFVVWGGANDLIAATSAQDIQNAAMREAGIVQTLISAGATEFIVPNLPPLGLVPRFNGSTATSVPATTAAAGFDQALAAYLGALPAQNTGKTLHIYQLDTYTLFNTIVAAPSAKNLANVTVSSQGNTAINPDTYLFWDDLHPTTYGHNMIATTAYNLLNGPITAAASMTSTNPQINLNGSITFTVTVNGTPGPPMGTVTISDGSTVLYSGVAVPGSNSVQATATFTTASLTAGTHTVQATFTGANGYTSSTTAPLSVVVTAPALSEAFSPSTLNIASGGTGTATLTLTPAGGYSGTATISCGTLPAHFTCGASPSSISLTGNNTAASTTITIGTSAMASLLSPSAPGAGHGNGLVLAFTFFPGIGLLGFAAVRRRRNLRGLAIAGVLVIVSGAAMLGTTGCAGNSNNAPKGSYTVPVTITVNGTTATQSLTVNVQ